METGWAVTTNGTILRTTDGSTWNTLTSPTFSGNANLAAYDDSHVVIAYGSGTFLVWDGNAWTSDTSDPTGKSSVAWAGGGSDVVACTNNSTVIQSRHASTWSATDALEPATISMRYLTARLDGYETPLETVTINGQQKQIPRDIKLMIDRAVNADAVGRSVLGTARAVIDDAPSPSIGRVYSSVMETALDNVFGESNVLREPGSAPSTNAYAINQSDVMLYSSNGSYDPAADSVTTWQRPFNTWIDGALGIFWNVSYDCRNLRSPAYANGIGIDTAANPQPYQLLVSGVPTSSEYDTHWIGLYATGSDTPIATATFSDGSAVIDMTNLTVPQDATLELHFPNDDLGHPGEVILSQDCGDSICNSQASGIAYQIWLSQCLTIDLIHEGCTAIAGNVEEPYGGDTPDPEVIFPLYARGSTVGESMWMGIPQIPWMQVVVGDPITAPFQVHPGLSFTDPTPPNQATVRGSVTLAVTATADSGGTIGDAQFSIIGPGGAYSDLTNDAQASYRCLWNTEAADSAANRIYPDGNYTVQATVSQSGGAVGSSTITRAVTLCTTGGTSVQVSQPSSDYGIVNGTSVETQAGGTPTGVVYWLFQNDDLDSAGQATTSPYDCTLPQPSGVYELQAIGYYGSPSCVSYSPIRMINLINGTAQIDTIGQMFNLGDSTPVSLVNIPIVAGPSDTLGPNMDSSGSTVFYVEDAGRSGGIRVEASEAFPAGTIVSISGTLRLTGTGVIERYVSPIAWTLPAPQPRRRRSR